MFKLQTAALLIGFTSTFAAAESPVTRIDWADDMLTIFAPAIPGGKLEVWYLEALCKPGSTDREWNETLIEHNTHLVNKATDGQRIELQTIAFDGVIINHEIYVSDDSVTFELTLRNPTAHASQLSWAQPCLRVGDFTGLEQETYHERCFIYAKKGRQFLHELPRTVDARYKGGQVYVPEGVDRDDVNPRPISTVEPAVPIIGCLSKDGNWVAAMAWDHTQELFQGVITCIHADFGVGGLAPGETKKRRGKLYIVPSDTNVIDRFHSDFAEQR